MPTNLTNNTITSTYNQLLHVSDGPTSSLKTVYSGTGTATALKVSTLAVAVDNLQFDANTISSTDTNGDIYLTPNGTGQVTISNANFTGTTTFTGTTVNGGNLRMTSNTLSSTNTNGNVIVAPNGTGDVQLDADTVRMGDANVDATLTTNGTGDMIISTNSGTNSGIIRIFDGVNGNITLTPNGTGDVVLSADTVQIGDSNVDATLTTSGTGDLILNTNSGTSSGTIRIYDGANGNITLTPNGTGSVVATKLEATTSIGYPTGTGGTVTQLTSRTTGVTLDKITGQITLFAAAITGHEADEFTLTNSTIGANDVVVVSIKSGCTAGTRKYYQVSVVETAAGSCIISVGNIDNATIPAAGTDTPVLQFAVIKGAIA